MHKIVTFNWKGQQVFQKVLPEVLPEILPEILLEGERVTFRNNPDTWVYRASLHPSVELLVVARVIVRPFAGPSCLDPNHKGE